MKKKLLTLLTLLLAVCSGAWADTVTFNFGGASDAVAGDLTGWTTSLSTNSTAKVLLGSATESGKPIKKGGSSYTGAIFELKNEAKGGTSTLTTSASYNLISNISFNITASDAGKSYLTVQVSPDADFSVPANIVTLLNNQVLNASGFVSSNGTFVNLSYDLTTATTGYLRFTFTNNSSSTGKFYELDDVVITYTMPTAANAPGTPTLTVDGGSVNAGTTTTIASTDAQTIYYCWSASSEAPAVGNAAYSSASGSSYVAEVPNDASIKYLHAYGYNNYNSGTASSIKTSNEFTITELTIAPEVSASIDKAIVRTSTTVTLTANVTAGAPEPTLQWYTCDADGSNASSIENETTTTYQPSTASTGTYYFLVKASNSAASDVASNVVKLKVVAAGVSGSVSDLVAISSDYTFIADDVTLAGTTALTANTLYDDGHIFAGNGNKAKTDKGTSIIDGETYYNSLNLAQGPVAFKVSAPCKATFYVGNNTGRSIKVGTSGDDDKYGSPDNGTFVWSTIITEAATVYIAGTTTGDYCLAGFKLYFNETITPAKEYTTFCCSSPLNFSGVEGLTAYVVTSATGGSATLQAVTDVPASTGLILKKTSGSSFDVPVGSATSLGETNNLLVGVTTATEVTAWADGSVYNYILSDGTFYRASGGTLAAGKAYLHCASNPESTGESADARGLRIVFADETTGINEVQCSKFNAQGDFHNLSGQRVSQPAKGLYIVNGKKVAIK